MLKLVLVNNFFSKQILSSLARGLLTEFSSDHVALYLHNGLLRMHIKFQCKEKLFVQLFQFNVKFEYNV